MGGSAFANDSRWRFLLAGKPYPRSCFPPQFYKAERDISENPKPYLIDQEIPEGRLNRDFMQRPQLLNRMKGSIWNESISIEWSRMGEVEILLSQESCPRWNVPYLIKPSRERSRVKQQSSIYSGINRSMKQSPVRGHPSESITSNGMSRMVSYRGKGEKSPSPPNKELLEKWKA